MKNKLQNGKKYNISNLFSGNKKIVIPDLQRDYTWGDRKHGTGKDELVSGFCDNLFEQFEQNKEKSIQLGMIYAYENPLDFINLADGQQRITTLFLLLGMLYRKNRIYFKGNRKNIDNPNKYLIELKLLRDRLISKYEYKKDDKEPHLQYAIRETTLYFLSDLVVNFFINGNYPVKEIIEQKWYFKEYDNDPSIQSMLSALEIIEKRLKDEVDLNDFSNWLISKVEFFYFDMVNREHGEEMFVVINTTGEPLTATENLKPILLGEIKDNKFNEQWEEREKYFWQNRSNEEQEADNGLKDFFTWYVRIQNKAESVNSYKYFLDKKNKGELQKDLENLHKYFEALKKIIDLLAKDNIQKQIKFITGKDVKSLVDLRSLNENQKNNVLLPLLTFILKISDREEIVIPFLRRLRKNYFDLEFEDREKNYIDWRYILQIIEKSESVQNCLKFSAEFEKIGNIGLPKAKWFNEEEQIKDKLKIQHKELIEEWEDFEDFMGDLTPLFNVASNDAEIDIIETYFKTYKKIRIKNYNFSDNIYLQNIYRLYSYLEYGRFEHRSVGGYGYCMLIEYNDKDFLKPKFSEIWEKFNQNNEGEIIEFLKDKLIDYFNNNILESKSLDVKLEDLNSFGHYEKVRLWALLEFLFNDNKKLDFSNSISCFWENKQNLINKEEDNLDYQIGNMLLGTSYFNNKTGWVQYNKYPLMKSIKGNESLNVTEQTEKYKKLIHEFIQ